MTQLLALRGGCGDVKAKVFQAGKQRCLTYGADALPATTIMPLTS